MINFRLTLTSAILLSTTLLFSLNIDATTQQTGINTTPLLYSPGSVVNQIGYDPATNTGTSQLFDSGSLPTVEQETNNTLETDEAAVETIEARISTNDTLLISYTLVDEENEEIALKMNQILGKRLFTIDNGGRLNLPIIGGIYLTGLDQKEATERLQSEHQLTGSVITVKILPLNPSGANALAPFGYNIFSDNQSTFAPANSLPVPSDYAIGPGDTIEVQLFGKINEQYNIIVSREGVINFPNIGSITLAGLTFDQAKKNLQEKIREHLIGVSAHISMGPLRSITVLILGDVNQPGAYTVSSLSTLTNAIVVSGGISESGSLRNIQLKRKGKVISKFDLYDLLLKGDTEADLRLQTNDVIFVRPIGATAGISGEVQRPAIYEFRNKTTIKDLVSLAGGLTSNASIGTARLERIEDAGRRIALDVNIDNDSDLLTKVQNGDVLFIDRVNANIEKTFSILGHVKHPGIHGWKDNVRLKDIISSPDQLLPNADLNYAVIKRQFPTDENIRVLTIKLRDLFDAKTATPIMLQPNDEVIFFRYDEIADRQALLLPIVESLQQQASLSVPAKIISIQGMVRAPGKYPLSEGMKLNDLILAGGELQESAFILQAELTRYIITDGKYRNIEHININVADILSNKPEANIELRPYDYLRINKMPTWNEQQLVELKGEVQFPGVYPISPGETLNSILKRAGGLTRFAFPEGSVFLREELKTREEENLKQLIERLESSLAATALAKMQTPEEGEALTIANQMLATLKTSKPMGRLVINLPDFIPSGEKIAENDFQDDFQDDFGDDYEYDFKEKYEPPLTPVIDASLENDIILESGDFLYIPSTIQEVVIVGDVLHPTSHLWNEDLSFEDYIEMSGGYSARSDTDRVYVVRANGSVVSHNQLDGSMFSDGEQIHPGDTIVVPMDIYSLRPLTLWTNISQIFFNIGVTIAQLNRAF